MKLSINQSVARSAGSLIVICLLGGCSGLLPKATPQAAFFSLDAPFAVGKALPRAVVATTQNAPTLVINPPRAAAGFDGRHIMYLREAHKLEYFAHNEWIDTPARMLAPLIAAAAERTGRFRAVLLTPSSAVGDLAVDTQLLRLQQDFSAQPSRVRIGLHVDIVELSSRRVLGSRDIDETVVAASDDPVGGVAAANAAVQRALAAFEAFCAEVVANWRPAGR